MTLKTVQYTLPVRERLVEAALDCFLKDDFYHVTTRRIAERAKANVSMIRYYFGSKEGLFEEMIRETVSPLLDALDGPMFESSEGFSDLLRLYYGTMIRRPEFPKLLLKILAMNQGPGKRFVQQLIERGRAQGAKRIEALKAGGQIDRSWDTDMVRMVLVSLAITPMLLKEIFEEEMEREMDGVFLEQFAEMNGHLFSAGLMPATSETPRSTPHIRLGVLNFLNQR